MDDAALVKPTRRERLPASQAPRADAESTGCQLRVGGLALTLTSPAKLGTNRAGPRIIAPTRCDESSHSGPSCRRSIRVALRGARLDRSRHAPCFVTM